ncbi:MAG TPA: alkaline phosphatase D family protein [Kofleriaceae bacterium]|nr:alkaline phosphatase D family protein [Kofleriaceae bacterium]
MSRSSITRRELGQLAASLGAALAFGCRRAPKPRPPWREHRASYPQGVASGDPAADSVLLWTRRPPSGDDIAHSLRVEVATDPAFSKPVAEGVAEISAATDWTCRFLAAGLSPATEYWYRFTDEAGNGSRIGRTLTAPAADDPRPARFAFVSCQDVTVGACNAWRKMIYEDERRPAGEQLGFVLHLGDFIYEVTWYAEDRPGGRRDGRRLRNNLRYPTGEKLHDYHVPATLEDYRTAYRVYLEDPDLQDARARFPFVPVWDNHEFSWQGWQSQQVFDGKTRPAQRLKVAANQAWFEYQPARVRNPGGDGLSRFVAPNVQDVPVGGSPDQPGQLDALGLATEPNNVAAVNSLIVYRALRWGANIDLIITDQHSFAPPPPNLDAFTHKEFRWVNPQEAVEICDSGRAYGGGHPPDTIRYGGADVPNPARDAPPQTVLGVAQKAWFLSTLQAATAPWKIWGHSLGNLVWRSDYHNLPSGLAHAPWPGSSYALFNGNTFLERAEILDLVREHQISGFAVVAGDKHSFWAGFLSTGLPPDKYEPLAVEFITGSISAPGLFEVADQRFPKDDPLLPLFVHKAADGTVLPTINMTMLHGVASSLKLHETGDVQQALAVSNPDVAPHLRFADLGGHGFSTVRATPDALEVEFVAIPRPLERATTPDGGPLAYRVVHRVQHWSAGQRPEMEQQIVEGTPLLATRHA